MLARSRKANGVMVAIDQSEISKIITDLLRIAKVAMPPKLYAEDRRVVTAEPLLAETKVKTPSARVSNGAAAGGLSGGQEGRAAGRTIGGRSLILIEGALAWNSAACAV
jgi:hypothetical protein